MYLKYISIASLAFLGACSVTQPPPIHEGTKIIIHQERPGDDTQIGRWLRDLDRLCNSSEEECVDQLSIDSSYQEL